MTLVYLAAYYVLMVTSWVGEVVVYAVTPKSLGWSLVGSIVARFYYRVHVKAQRRMKGSS